MIQTNGYPCPLPGGAAAQEYALGFDAGRECRLLVIPALFDEANRLRRLTVEVMRRLDGAGIDSFLPDLPGTNESKRDLSGIEAEDWAMAAEAAARHFEATHVLAIRGGALLVPKGLRSWHYAPTKGASILRTMLRARVLSAREAGREETVDGLLAEGLEQGLELAGYRLSAEMIRQLQALAPVAAPGTSLIEQDMVGGSGLWLRAEPDESPDQADALAAIVTMGIAA
ncbi:hypothetical protein [Novosphingobium sp.]|uniref:hypothetical protein n=1 Tax=Novosphingobium sp. TaxID=1874826 RepID=UPI0035B04B49